MWAAIACMIIIPITLAIMVFGVLGMEDCIDMDDIKEFIVFLDARADDRKQRKQGRGKFYGKNSKYQ